MVVMNIDSYLQLVINGFCSGVGGSIGTYFTLRLFIKHLEKIESRVRNGHGGK